MSGMLFINNKSAEAGAPQLGGGKTGRRTLSFHCVTSAFRHTAAHSLLRLAYYSVQARACVTYVFTAGLRGMKRGLHFGPNLT